MNKWSQNNPGSKANLKSTILATMGLIIATIFIASAVIGSDLSPLNKLYLSPGENNDFLTQFQLPAGILPERVLAIAGNDSFTQNQTDNNNTTSTDGKNGSIVILPPSFPPNILEDRRH